ncbi:MAG: LysR family transcriptional regulator substrate-binding protein, partial [Nocardioides sp.]
MSAFRVGFVTGATPDKWGKVWRERYPRERLELVPVTEDEQEERLRSGEVDMALVRLPVDREGLHCIPLYDEVPVVVAGHEHFVAAADDVRLDDLVDEQLVRP